MVLNVEKENIRRQGESLPPPLNTLLVWYLWGLYWRLSSALKYRYEIYTFVCVLVFLYWLLLAYSLYIAWRRSIIAVSHISLLMSHFVSIFPSPPVMISVSHLFIVFHSVYPLNLFLFSVTILSFIRTIYFNTCLYK
jgi:hypothetical protein